MGTGARCGKVGAELGRSVRCRALQVKKLGFHEKPLKSFIQGSDSDLILMFSKDPFSYLWRMDSGEMKMEARRPVRGPPQHSK